MNNPTASLLCESCGVKRKARGYKYCSQRCAAMMKRPTNDSEPCNYCKQKPKVGRYPYCSNRCAAYAAKANSLQIPTKVDLCVVCRQKPKTPGLEHCSRECAVQDKGRTASTSANPMQGLTYRELAQMLAMIGEAGAARTNPPPLPNLKGEIEYNGVWRKSFSMSEQPGQETTSPTSDTTPVRPRKESSNWVRTKSKSPQKKQATEDEDADSESPKPRFLFNTKLVEEPRKFTLLSEPSQGGGWKPPVLRIQEPKSSRSETGKTVDYKGKGKAKAVDPIDEDSDSTCMLPGCWKPVQIHGDGSKRPCCSKRHEDEMKKAFGQDEEPCIFCKAQPQRKKDFFCGDFCREKALNKSLLRVQIPASPPSTASASPPRSDTISLLGDIEESDPTEYPDENDDDEEIDDSDLATAKDHVSPITESESIAESDDKTELHVLLQDFESVLDNAKGDGPTPRPASH